jgi:hypothetical protein
MSMRCSRKGDVPGAKSVLQAHEEADRKAGLDTSQFAALHQLLDTNPQGATARSLG